MNANEGLDGIPNPLPDSGALVPPLADGFVRPVKPLSLKVLHELG
jgi:hypothetical protein